MPAHQARAGHAADSGRADYGAERSRQPDQVQALHRGGFLHDIGMLAIPDTVLRKGGPLEPEEYALIKSHTVVGDGLCGNLRSLQAIRPIVRHHHELLDGSGYPDGLRGDDVPLLAQVIGIVDAYDALTTERPYQRAQSVEHAPDLLRLQAARGWRRSALVDEFSAIVRGSGTSDDPHDSPVAFQ